jgi:uncharacterized protein (TIGR03089 family)
VSSVPALLSTLAGVGGAPRLTWYGDGGERVELSGAVLANWVTKSTNLLVEELDTGPGTELALDLPPHWRTIVWALAGWRCGACVGVDAAAEPTTTSGPTGTSPDVVVTTRPSAWPGAADLVAVELGALARRFAGELPPGATDAAAAVMTYADALGYVPPADPAAAALRLARPSATSSTARAADATVTHAGLLDWALTGTPAEGSAATTSTGRVLVPASSVAWTLRACLGAWARGGSVVLVDDATSALEQDDPGRWQRLLASERVDDVLGRSTSTIPPPAARRGSAGPHHGPV